MSTKRPNKNEIISNTILDSLKGIEFLSPKALKDKILELLKQKDISISNATYHRTLGDLKNKGEILKSSDGEKYSLPVRKIISGIDIFTELGCKISASPKIVNSGLGIFKGRPTCYHDPLSYHIVFMINESLLYLKIGKTHHPLKIHIARTHDQEKESLALLKKQFGEELIVLRFPNKRISSCILDPTNNNCFKKLGHALITLNTNNISGKCPKLS